MNSEKISNKKDDHKEYSHKKEKGHDRKDKNHYHSEVHEKNN